MQEREVIIKTADDLINGNREQQHGNAFDSHELIAQYWSVYLGQDILAIDVANMMELLKIARSGLGEHNLDDYVDRVGYAALAGEFASK